MIIEPGSPKLMFIKSQEAKKDLRAIRRLGMADIPEFLTFFFK
jgi:hypothetical protein